MKIKKELVLTFLNGDGRTHKIALSHFLENIDGRTLAEHLATLPGFNYATQHQLKVGQLTHCIRASYVITHQYLLFRTNSSGS